MELPRAALMDSKQYEHFSKMEWYRPYRDDAGPCLTEIEKRNLQKIEKWEKKNP